MPNPRKAKPTASEIPAGRIAGAFGIKGELKCDPSGAGRTVFSPGATLRCERNGVSETIELAAVREHQNRLLIRIVGVDDATAAEAYAGAKLFAPRDAIELEEGEYLDEDLTGCAVTGIDGTNYGKVVRVEHYPANDMLIVGRHMVPMVAAIVKSIDVKARTILIDPPAGLFE